MSRICLTFLLTLILGACTVEKSNEPDSTTTAIQAIYQAVHDKNIPDRRVDRLDVEIFSAGKDYVLRGETTLPEVKAAFLAALDSAGLAYTDSIVELPSALLGEKNYALSRHAVVNLRSAPGHSQELATQVLLGTPLRVLKQHENWYFVQCPDGYLAWLNEGELVRLTASELAAWKVATRYVFTPDYGYSYARADTGSQHIGDLVRGSILVKVGVEGNFTEVAYPDGRTAYVPTSTIVPFEEWLKDNQPSFILAKTIAEQQLGKPYVWGGTSPKGMDCSGFTKTVYWQQGLIIPRDASQQVHAGSAVKYDEKLNGLEAGDFLFFGRYREDGSEKVTHVGIYLGEGAFIHSGADNGANKIENLLPTATNYAEHRRQSLLRARRLSAGSAGVQRVSEHPWYWSL